VEASLIIDRLELLDGNVQLDVTSFKPPVDLSYAVLLRSGGSEWRIGNVAFKRGASGHSVLRPDTRLFWSDSPLAETAEVVFRPDPQAAVDDPEIASYWGGEIVAKNVPVRDPSDIRNRQQLRRMDGFTRAGIIDAPTPRGPVVIPPAPLDPAKGVVVKIESFPAAGGQMVRGAPALSTRKVLVFPNIPFLDRTSEGDSTTIISCLLEPGQDAEHFKLVLQFQVTNPSGREGNSMNQPIGLAVDKPFSLGVTNKTARTVTLTRP
jgi:hypothetical protein